MKSDSTKIWLQYQDELYRFIRTKIRQEDDARDVMQDVWLKLFSYCCIEGEIKNRRAWLFRVTMNTIADFYRRKRNSVFSDELPDELADTIIDQEIEKDMSVSVEHYIKMLPVEYSQPLRMDSLMGMKQEKIAEKMNLEHGAVRTRLHRARKMLKEKIEACFCVVKDAAGSILAFTSRHDCNDQIKPDYKNCDICL